MLHMWFMKPIASSNSLLAPTIFLQPSFCRKSNVDSTDSLLTGVQEGLVVEVCQMAGLPGFQDADTSLRGTEIPTAEAGPTNIQGVQAGFVRNKISNNAAIGGFRGVSFPMQPFDTALSQQCSESKQDTCPPTQTIIRSAHQY